MGMVLEGEVVGAWPLLWLCFSCSLFSEGGLSSGLCKRSDWLLIRDMALRVLLHPQARDPPGPKYKFTFPSM